MASLILTVKPRQKGPRKILVEMDVDRFEKLAASLGLFSDGFLNSLERAEKDHRAGRLRKIKSLKDLRK